MSETDNMNVTVSPSQAFDLLVQCMLVKKPAMLWGPPGIGKSDLIQQIGNASNRPVIDLRLILMDPTDIKGIPYYNPETKQVRWQVSSELPREGTSMENAILFLDEINSAPQSVQGAAYQLILNRKIGEYQLPAGVDIVAAGNRETDRGVVYKMPSALANRFVHFELAHSVEDWKKWAIGAQINPLIVGFIAAHPQFLFEFDPKRNERVFATPRMWHYLSTLMQGVDPLSEKFFFLANGTVGRGKATEFQAHVKLYDVLPNPQDILSGKTKRVKDMEPSVAYSLVLSLANMIADLYKAIPSDVEDKEATKEYKAFKFALENAIIFCMDNTEEELLIFAMRTIVIDFNVKIKATKMTFFKEFARRFDHLLEYIK